VNGEWAGEFEGKRKVRAKDGPLVVDVVVLNPSIQSAFADSGGGEFFEVLNQGLLPSL